MGTFVLKNIDMTLNPSSIQRAINEVRRLKKDLADALSQLARILTSQGVEIAQMHIARMTHWSGNLEQSMTGYYDPESHCGYISTDVEYAILVEYGTGIIGEASPHPGIGAEDWKNPSGTTVGGKTYSQYDQEGHGEAGWKYYLAEAGTYVWTQGEPSKPFMYFTLRELQEEAEARGGVYIGQYIP